jgi:hypothetical protein
VTIKITLNDRGNPPGKLADAELHFTEDPRRTKPIGFSIWEARVSSAGRNVTFPARHTRQRRAAQLRCCTGGRHDGWGRIRELILDATDFAPPPSPVS